MLDEQSSLDLAKNYTLFSLVSFRACIVISLPQTLKDIFGEKTEPLMGALKGLSPVTSICLSAMGDIFV